MADASGSKRAALLYILDILKERNDAAHGIDQQEIAERLENDYGLTLKRETIGRNLDVILSVYPENVHYRLNNAKKRCGWYWTEDAPEPEFDPSEVRLLMGVVECYGKLDYRYKRDLMKRIAKLAQGVESDEMPARIEPAFKRRNRYRLFYNIGILGEAIALEKKVSFSRGEYTANGEIVRAEHAHTHVVSPQHIAFKNNTYMLISTFEDDEGVDRIMHSCIDTMFDLAFARNDAGELIDADPLSDATGRKTFDMQQYLDEHLYMFGGKPERVVVRIKNNPLNVRQIYEQFGSAVKGVNPSEDDRYLDFAVDEPLAPMTFWALQFSTMAEIIEPESLRETIVERGQTLQERYGTGEMSPIEYISSYSSVDESDEIDCL